MSQDSIQNYFTIDLLRWNNYESNRNTHCTDTDDTRTIIFIVILIRFEISYKQENSRKFYVQKKCYMQHASFFWEKLQSILTAQKSRNANVRCGNVCTELYVVCCCCCECSLLTTDYHSYEPKKNT